MTMKMLFAAVLGAVAMFIWAAVAHMALPLGEAGVSEIPNESAVMGSMEGNKAGLYVFPGTGLGPNATSAEKHKAMEEMSKDFAKHASGLLMYRPPGQPFEFGKRLTFEFITELIECLLGVFLLAQTRLGTMGGRIGFFLVVGILAATATNISYWNWYGFPVVYTAGYMCIQIVGFLLAGIVIALVLKNTPPRSTY